MMNGTLARESFKVVFEMYMSKNISRKLEKELVQNVSEVEKYHLIYR